MEECEEGDGEAEVEVVEEETDGDLDEEEDYPAVIVEEVPGRGLEQCFSAQVLVYDDGTYLMQDVGDEQEVVTEVVETGERAAGREVGVHGWTVTYFSSEMEGLDCVDRETCKGWMLNHRFREGGKRSVGVRHNLAP